MLRWTWGKLDGMAEMTSLKARLAVEVLGIESERHPMMAPHRVSATIMVTYFNVKDAERVERRMKEIMGRRGRHWTLTLLSDRPPMKERTPGLRLAKAIEDVARELQLPVVRHLRHGCRSQAWFRRRWAASAGSARSAATGAPPKKRFSGSASCNGRSCWPPS